MAPHVPERARDAIERARPLFDAHVMPLERAFLSEGGDFATLGPTLDAARGAVREAGLFAPHMPAELGGMGLTVTECAHLWEFLGRSPLGLYVFNAQAPDAGNMELLLHYGSEGQTDQWLRPLAAGEMRSCFGMTEPESPGSNPVVLRTRAVPQGDGWRIDGRKWFTSGADGASLCIVMAVTDPDADRPHARASMFLVPTDTPGFVIERNLPVMGHAGSGWASHAEVRLDGVQLGAEALLGERGAGFKMAQARLGPGRIHHCMRWLGICERAFEMMCQRAATRELSPGVLLGSKQMVQAWIAESRAEIDAARWLVLDAAETIDRDGSAAARTEISAMKFFVGGVLDRVLDRALQTHGGLGMLDDTPIAWWYRHERAGRIYDGADEVHKAAVARRILKSYGARV